MLGNSWRTTVLGIVTIVAAIAGAAKAYLTGQPVDYGTVLAALTAGWGLIHAADSAENK